MLAPITAWVVQQKLLHRKPMARPVPTTCAHSTYTLNLLSLNLKTPNRRTQTVIAIWMTRCWDWICEYLSQEPTRVRLEFVSLTATIYKILSVGVRALIFSDVSQLTDRRLSRNLMTERKTNATNRLWVSQWLSILLFWALSLAFIAFIED